MHILLAVITLFSLAFQSQNLCAQTRSQGLDKHSAVLLSYHRIGEDLYPTNNLSIDDFHAQLQEIQTGDYTVLPVPEIIKSLKSGNTLPPQTVGIIFEGAYASAYKNAIPRLLKSRIPFTIFYASDMAERSSNEYMSISNITSLARYNFIDIGILPASYVHLYENSEEENERLVNKAKQKFRKYFKKDPKLFSYPYGEYNQNYLDFIKNHNFDAALSLQSGAIHYKSDFMTLPRFSMTEGYGDLERFRLISSSLPLPFTDISPNTTLQDHDAVISAGFTIPDEYKPLIKQISCFMSSKGRIDFEVLGENRIEIREENLSRNERIRLNCTAPGVIEDGVVTRWRWFGMLLKFHNHSENTLEKNLDNINEQAFNNNRPDGPQ